MQFSNFRCKFLLVTTYIECFQMTRDRIICLMWIEKVRTILTFFLHFFFQFLFYYLVHSELLRKLPVKVSKVLFQFTEASSYSKKKLYLLNCKPQQSIFALFFCCCWHYGSHQFIGLPNTEKSAIKMIWEQVVASKFFF